MPGPGARASRDTRVLAPGSFTRVVAVGGLLSLPLMAILVESAVLREPGYSSMRDTISHLSTPGSPYSSLVNAAFMVQGVLVGLFGVAFARLLGGPLGPTIAVLFGIYVAANVGAGIFQNDDTAKVIGGLTADTLHDRLAQAGVSAISLAVLAVAASTNGRVPWHGLASFGILVVLINATLAPPIVFEWFEAYHGLFERLMFVATLGWIMLASYRVLRLPGKGAA